jgi:2-keto-3-deoxy-6-phosphogluconate aldolase
MGSKFSVARMRKELAAQTMTSVATSGDTTVGSGLVLSDVAAANLTAAGSDVNSSVAIVNHVTNVSGTTDTGVKLPNGATSGEVYVLSNVGVQQLKVYATGSDTINGLASTNGLILSASTGAVAVKAGSTNWAFIYSKV